MEAGKHISDVLNSLLLTQDGVNNQVRRVGLDDSCRVRGTEDMGKIGSNLQDRTVSKFRLRISVTFKAAMEAKYGAPVYSLLPPITPILPASPLCLPGSRGETTASKYCSNAQTSTTRGSIVRKDIVGEGEFEDDGLVYSSVIV